MLKIILQRFKNNATPFGLISIIGGFVTDVLQPIAPFSSYIFYASTTGTLIIFLTFLFKSTLRKKLSNSLVLALSIMIITGTISLLQKYSDNDKKGVLANNFKVFEKFQNQLGIIVTQVSEVKDISIINLEETKKLSKQIEKTKKELGEKIDQISPKNKLDQSKMKINYSTMFRAEKSYLEFDVHIQPVEYSREMFMSEDGKNYISLGFDDIIDTRTGLKWGKNRFTLKETEFKKSFFYIKYLDINSNIKGPFEIELDMYDELLKNDKRYLKNHAEWVWYRWELPYKMWSLNQLFEYRCALKSVSFKMDNKKEVKIDLPDCKEQLKNNPLILFPRNKFLKINSPENLLQYIWQNTTKQPDFVIKEIKIRVEYYDGETSVYRTFKNYGLSE
ncbi:hypothetical protein N9T65_00080 [Candidatus Pelagibacter sp.]|nr:hypothetical protein [Candidatus Pelagibacter sp.]MDA9663258.1 hypothetical protein [Candidatus Pelagibacter sp.]